MIAQSFALMLCQSYEAVVLQLTREVLDPGEGLGQGEGHVADGDAAGEVESLLL